MLVQKSRRTVARQSRHATTGRNVLVAEHVGLVHHVARQLASRLSTEADHDELISAGSIGLMQAAEAFDASRGLSFSTFAVPRIRGAMLDELRRLDYMPRNVRKRSRDVTRVRDTLTGSLQRPASDAEVSRALRVDADDVRRWEFDAHSSQVLSFHQPVRSEADTTLADVIGDDQAPSIEDLMARECEVEELKRAIAGLKEQERTVLALNFFEELKLSEIAEVLGLSVCRISQIRTAALEKLRVTLSELRAA